MTQNFFIKRIFNDFNEMVKALYAWKINLIQLKKQNIDDSFIQMKVNDIILTQAKFTGLTHQTGDIPPGRTFAYHIGENSQLLWRKKKIPLDALMIFPLNSELDVVTKGSINLPHTISLPDQLIISRLEESEKVLYHDLVSNNDLILIESTKMENLREIFEKYMQSAEENPELVHEKNYQVCFEEELISSLIEAILSEKKNTLPKVKQNLSKIWNEIHRYIETHKQKPIMVSQLSKEVGISERNLSRIFNDRFSVSPKTYLNRLRLNGVKEELMQLNSNNINVVAHNWGFWHMGQFAADYKNLFGELPSQTLQKKNSKE